ncbi:hypothetical protein BS50DRAFT_70689 [Corynespora cassiicola Philippines]|uniref:Uncharacterized protein n=1 Tax=Corynespora cassiicola Philippines TaxID=1448308 RepID=A0A2T2NFW8_CORCC|nr:hypothetical protein BS50DRAFT_70689 [Corynespora cassiicola Philippines]
MGQRQFAVKHLTIFQTLKKVSRRKSWKGRLGRHALVLVLPPRHTRYLAVEAGRQLGRVARWPGQGGGACTMGRRGIMEQLSMLSMEPTSCWRHWKWKGAGGRKHMDDAQAERLDVPRADQVANVGGQKRAPCPFSATTWRRRASAMQRTLGRKQAKLPANESWAPPFLDVLNLRRADDGHSRGDRILTIA